MFRPLISTVAVLLLAACASGTSQPGAAVPGTKPTGPAATPLPGWRVSPGQFVSLRFAPRDEQTSGPGGFLEVALNDVRTGAIIRRLLPATTGSGLAVTGLALDRSGDLWITYSKGPAYGGDVASGDPHAHTCANQIDVVHARTGVVTVFLRTGDNVLISGATPSPGGQRLVYTESACTGYLDSYLHVTDLGTGRSWTIGQQLPDCHLLTSPAWSADAKTLLMAYGPSSQPASSGPSGVCSQWWAGRLVQADSGAGQPDLAGRTVHPDPGCQITSVADTAAGDVLAIEGCRTAPEFLDGPARLLVLTGSRITSRLAIGECDDGGEIALNHGGTSALFSVYMSCGAKGTRLWQYHDGTLRPITSIAGDTAGASMLTWIS